MKYNERLLFIIVLCIVFGIILIVLGVISQEITISKNQCEGCYGNVNIGKRIDKE